MARNSLASAALARLMQDPNALAAAKAEVASKLPTTNKRDAYTESIRSPHAERHTPTQRTARERELERQGVPPSALEGINEYYATPKYIPTSGPANPTDLQALRALITMAHRQGMVKDTEAHRWDWVFRHNNGMTEQFCKDMIGHFRSLLGNKPQHNR